ncbi:MAG TPA: Gfo/Idh/MocA family oxidoreductase, partial [bacterium]|nr:Gfo/Idh/MocA family oxidoreductase [bacterium]
MESSVGVAVVGLGFMGKKHLGVYFGNPRAKVVAVCDSDPEKLHGDWSRCKGNIEDHSESVIDLSDVAKYTNYDSLLKDPNVQVVDITLPSHLHTDFVTRALDAKKNVLCEKPMALTLKECDAMIAAAKANRRRLMVAHCIRFWPEFVVARNLIREGKFGRVCAAHFRRYTGLPEWSWKSWLLDARASGSAVLDLHIHDVDFINSIFGRPLAVTAQGVPTDKRLTGFKRISCLYQVKSGAVVTAEAGWDLPSIVPFEMSFTIVMERVVLTYSSSRQPTLMAHYYDDNEEPLPLPVA